MKTAEGALEAGVAIGIFLQPLRPERCANTIVVDAREDEGVQLVYSESSNK